MTVVTQAQGVTHIEQNTCVIPDLSVKDLLSVIPCVVKFQSIAVGRS